MHDPATSSNPTPVILKDDNGTVLGTIDFAPDGLGTATDLQGNPLVLGTLA